MVTAQLRKLQKKPHVATPGTGTPCRIHVLQYIINKFYCAERWYIKPPEICDKKILRDANTMGKEKKEGGGADPVGALGKNRQ